MKYSRYQLEMDVNLIFCSNQSWMPCVIPGSQWRYPEVPLRQARSTSESRTLRQSSSLGQGAADRADINGMNLQCCPFCPLAFTSVRELNQHKSRAHLVKKSQHICTICGKGITRKDDFEDHMNRHRNIKAHTCPHCAQQFTFKNNLRHHMRSGVCSKYRNMSFWLLWA